VSARLRQFRVRESVEGRPDLGRVEVGTEQLGAGLHADALGQRPGDDRVEAERVDETRDDVDVTTGGRSTASATT
jgi:hypothetical protein